MVNNFVAVSPHFIIFKPVTTCQFAKVHMLFYSYEHEGLCERTSWLLKTAYFKSSRICFLVSTVQQLERHTIKQ